jgi:hypothetical protein
MALTQAQMDAVASYALDYYIKGDAFDQTIQDKPLLSAIRGKQKSFPGGKGKISIPVVGEYLDSDANFFKGFSFDDSVTFQNPNAVKRANYDYFEIHAGISVTFTELKQDGISVADSAFGEKTTKVSGREQTALTNLLEHKLSSMSEGWSRKMNQMFWRDGAQDSGKQSPGLLAFIVDAPTTGTLGGLSRVTNTWWRNRTNLGISAGSDNLTQTLRQEVRQLTRYGGKPNLILCGSKFLDALEKEVASKSLYSQSGVAGSKNIASPSVTVTGIGTFVYDPTLDDLQGIMGNAIDYSKRCYMIDSDAICGYVMEGEDNKVHAPARPENKYALYRSMTWTGGLTAKRLNSSGVYSIA